MKIKYVLSLIIIFCLMVNSAFALTQIQAKAIMANITAVVALQIQTVVVPLPVPKPVIPDSGVKPNSIKSSCPTGNCPLQQVVETETETETKSVTKSGCANGNCPSGRFKIFNR